MSRTSKKRRTDKNARAARRRTCPLSVEQLEERLVPAVLDLTGIEFRTIDGVNNNLTGVDLNDPTTFNDQGAADTTQIRFGYGDDFPDDVGDTIITSPNARTVSNELLAQSGDVINDRYLTDWAFQWGQWITHDMDLTLNGSEFNVLSDGTTGNFNIPVLGPDDPFDPFGTGTVFIPFNRSEFAEGTGVADDPNTPVNEAVRREVVNSITSYIDASMVYGSDDERADNLRTFVGGMLKTSADGQLLPLNTVGEENADAFGEGADLFLAGDVRANEQVNLTVVHTLFVREHNRLAERIHQLFPDLNDEEIYQIARRIVGAEMQIITYEEYLPAILGYDLAPQADAAAYDPNVDASVTNSFAHAAFRFGHSQVNETTLLVNNAGLTVDDLNVDEAFFNEEFLKLDPNNVGLMLKGLASQLGQEVDLLLVDGIRNNLFGPPGAGGLDLGALDIQRARDHGLPDFNNLVGAYRALGLDAAGAVVRYTSFADFAAKNPLAAAAGTVDALEEMYGSIDLIDPFVGMLAEDHLPGTSVGRTLNAIISNQFARLRDGDRFFYTQDSFLQSDAVKQIIDLDNLTLAQVIKANTQITNIQDNVFFDKSVLIFEAPEAGSNISVVAGLGVVSIINNSNGQLLALRSLANVSQVILIGSNTGADVFNLFIAAANGGLEGGVIAYGGGSTGNRLNVFGRPFTHDTFTVTDTSFSTGTVDVLARPPENAITQSVSGAQVDINGNDIFSSGFETIRLVTLGGNDTINNLDMIALAVVALWNPLSGN